MQKQSYYSIQRLKGVALVAAVVVASATMQFTSIGNYLKTSVVGYPEHAPYDGLVYPISQVPDWAHLDSGKWSGTYSQLNSSDLTPLPYYNPSQLQTPAENLKWGNSDDNVIRNAKITYPVPYMGSYKLDGKENTGSHPAVDIKTLIGTPVFAIGNGTVIKVSNQSSGFGHHIVLQHNNFPSYSSSTSFETLYSSYSHMDQVLVNDGDVVVKGQQIGTVGQTGTATTPHLHFQIDNSEAPWHPYWPFSWSEIEDAGLSFFDAVNEGYGKSNATLTTINPLKYVQKYMGQNVVYVPEDTSTADSLVTTVDESSPVVEDTPVVEDAAVVEPFEAVEVPVEVPVVEPVVEPKLVFEFVVRDNYYTGKGSEFQVQMRDQFGDIFSDGFSGEVVISSANGNFVAGKSLAGVYQFDSSGNLVNTMKMMKPGKDRIKISYEGEVYYSNWFNIIDGGTDPGFSDLSAKHKYYEAVSYLVDKGVVNGYNDGTFKPNATVTRVEALKFIYEGIGERIYGGYLPFSDVDRKAWYGNYLFTAYDKGAVNGYSDGTFKPTQIVNKAEFYKLLFNGMGIDVASSVGVAPFDDVPVHAWFAPYVSYAKQLEITEPGMKNMYPGNGMTRGEVAYAIYRVMQIMK